MYEQILLLPGQYPEEVLFFPEDNTITIEGIHAEEGELFSHWTIGEIEQVLLAFRNALNRHGRR